MGTFNSSTFNSGLFGGGSVASIAPVKVSDLIYRAYRMAGVLNAPGRGYAPAELSDGLMWLNQMIDAWAVDRLNIFTIRIDQLPIVSGQQAYTIGVDPTGQTVADFNVPRPVEIQTANFIVPTNPLLRCAMDLLDDQEWASIRVQDVGTSIPSKLYNDGAFPFSTLYLWPFPNAAGTLELYTWQTLGQFSSPDDSVIIPPGYLAAITYNLAVELNAIMPRANMKPAIAAMAIKYKMDIQSLNAPAPIMISDGPKGNDNCGVYNWLSNSTN